MTEISKNNEAIKQLYKSQGTFLKIWLFKSENWMFLLMQSHDGVVLICWSPLSSRHYHRRLSLSLHHFDSVNSISLSSATMVEPVELPSRLGILPFRNKVLLPGAIIRIRCTSSSRYASRMLLITSLFSCSVFSMDDFTLMQNHDVFSRPSNKFWFTSFWSLRFWPFLLFGNLVSLSLDHQFLAVSWCSHFF